MAVAWRPPALQALARRTQTATPVLRYSTCRVPCRTWRAGSTVSVRYASDQRAPPGPGPASSTSNPLEVLRGTKDPRERAQLMQQLDANWNSWFEVYTPSEAEQLISSELGIWPYNMMLFAVQHPHLSDMDVLTCIKPSIRSLKGMGMDPSDIWFLMGKRLPLFQHAVCLERWLDFLSAQDCTPRHVLTFLLQAPDGFITDCTLHQASKVVAYLRSLNIKAEYLMPRIVCAQPGILQQDVAGQLQPVVTFLMSLGVELPAIACVLCNWPEMLLMSVTDNCVPFIDYLKAQGCSTLQAAKVLQEAPHLVKQKPDAMLGPRIARVQALGFTFAEMRQLVSTCSSWLTSPGSPEEQLEFLSSLGFSKKQVRDLVRGCPALLADKPLELERKVAYLQESLEGSLGALLEHPTYLGANLMQVIGPRHSFLTSKGLEGRLVGTTGSREVALDLSALVAGADVEFVDSLGASINEYEGFRTAFEEEYTAQLSRDAAKEFQDELKKLGIYEGA